MFKETNVKLKVNYKNGKNLWTIIKECKTNYMLIEIHHKIEYKKKK